MSEQRKLQWCPINLNFFSVQPLCLCGGCSQPKLTTETQRAQRLHREIQTRVYLSVFLILVLPILSVSACRQEVERGRVPAEVQEVVASVGENIAQERYDQIYDEASDLWRQDVTLEKSNEVFKTLRTKLGKVESRSLHSATEQQNSGGVLKGHVFILSYQTRFERGEGMETFTLVEQNGRWLLARYFVNSMALQ
jgi:hypothetical protein